MPLSRQIEEIKDKISKKKKRTSPVKKGQMAQTFGKKKRKKITPETRLKRNKKLLDLHKLRLDKLERIKNESKSSKRRKKAEEKIEKTEKNLEKLKEDIEKLKNA